VTHPIRARSQLSNRRHNLQPINRCPRRRQRSNTRQDRAAEIHCRPLVNQLVHGILLSDARLGCRIGEGGAGEVVGFFVELVGNRATDEEGIGDVGCEEDGGGRVEGEVLRVGCLCGVDSVAISG